MSAKPTLVTLFAGGGGSTMGAMAAGYDPVLSVEYDAKIANTYAENFGDKHLMVADVRAVNYKPYAGATMLTASPVCTRASRANPKAGETELDITCGQAVADALRDIRPRHFVLENVAEYRGFAAYKIITDALDVLGYWWQASVLNSADFGVPQTRKRLIVRASLDFLLPLPSAVPWRGWYHAVKDELPNCKQSELAQWQKDRLPEYINDSFLAECKGRGFGLKDVHTTDIFSPCPTITASETRHPKRAVLIGDQSAAAGVGVQSRDGSEPSFTLCAKGGKGQGAAVLRAVLVEGDAAGERPPRLLREGEPAFTLKTGGGGRVHRALLIEDLNTSRQATVRLDCEPSPAVTQSTAGRRDGNMPRALLAEALCIALNSRCMANLQSIPAWYKLPTKGGDAATIIGNMVPPLMMQRISETFIN